MHILVTGGAGFIGSNFLNMFVKKHPEHTFYNVDALTYAGDLNNLEISDQKNYRFFHGDITDNDFLRDIFKEIKPEIIVHFAAESHVDQSIKNPGKFIRTNINGTYNLLQNFYDIWHGDFQGFKKFHHISTDEVFGYLGNNGAFKETTPYNPSSPYSASKASSDHLVRAFNRTFNMPITITNCSNNYGPYQHDEKMIPTIIRNALLGNNIPVYGTGKNVRDWLFVGDHCEAIWNVMFNGTNGESYNIGSRNDISNIKLIHQVLLCLSNLTDKKVEDYESLITFIQDRKGHDFRYAIDPSKISEELNWHSSTSFEDGLKKTTQFYLDKYTKKVQ